MITKTTFKQKLDGKVWKAIQAMIDGVKRQSERSDFRIHMLLWGCTDGIICFGCAATSCVQEICGHDFIASDLKGIGGNGHYNWTDGVTPVIDGESDGFTKQADALNMCDHDLGLFENAIDKLRRGNRDLYGDVSMIFNYMGAEFVPPDGALLELTTDTWEKRIYKYQSYANKLKKLDI